MPLAGHSIWEIVSRSPVHNLWDFEGVSPLVVFKRSAQAFIADNLLSRAAELGYYFLFALFPTLLGVSSIVGLMAQRASNVYSAMLGYLAILVPASAYQLVIETFNQTTRASSGGKVALGIAAALWSASVGFGAIQDTANIVYKVTETRPFWKVKLEAICVTALLSVVILLTLGVLLGADFMNHHLPGPTPWMTTVQKIGVHAVAWAGVLLLLMLLFAIVYYFAPDVKQKKWHWFTPGAAVGMIGWLAASIGLRIYLHYFNSYTATYGSLGAVIILLTWFYVTGLMLLAGAEVNSEIQAAVTEKRLAEQAAAPQD